MAEIKIAGVMRAGAFSPNHIGNDAAIFNLVADQLRKRGCEFNIYSEEQLIAGGVGEHVIVNMCREPRSIEILQRREDAGDLVINSGYGIENCVRERMCRILLGNGLPYPQSLIVDTNEGIRERLAAAGIDRCWIKRADQHTRHKEDVSYVRHAEEAQEVLQEYFLRGIPKAVINRHLDGDQVKFYGVLGGDFFHCFVPNAKADTPEFDPEALRKICEEAADALGVTIYGGDCVIGRDGSLSLIDFDDWPSFAPCRGEAAPYIAREILHQIKLHQKK